jgi:spermidine/putrescine transport system substrate-binding protein
MSTQPPSIPHEVARLVRSGLSPRTTSRRAVLGGAGAAGLAAALSACGTGGTSSGGGAEKPKAVADRSDTDKVVNWANWALYLDYDEKTKTYPTLEEFTKQTDIKATYAEDIEDNDSYYGKIQGQLKNGQDIGKDVIVLTDYMAARVIRQGYAQKLDKAVIPNAANILDDLRDVDFDPGRNYSLTWQSGYAGLAWNQKELERLGVPTPLRSVSDLWRPELKGRVEVLSEFRDTLGLIMLEQGVDISQPFGADKFGAALEVLEKQLGSTQIRQVKGNSYKEDLISGDALAVIAWSGDITQLNVENGDKWKFALPDKGGTLWSDNLLIPIGSPHKKNAEILMNYYYSPDVAAKVAAYVNYICPVKGAREAIQKIDPALADQELIFPPATVNAKVFRTLQPDEETQFAQDFQKVLGV